MSLLRHRDYGTAKLIDVIIDNSDTCVVGATMKWRNGNLEAVTAGDAIGGVVVDLVDKDGVSIIGSTAKTGSATAISGQGGAGTTVTVASDNETVDFIAARIDTSKEAIYSAEITGTMNTTTASNKGGGWVDLSDYETVDETTHTRTITTGGQMKNWGVDPEDSTRMLVSINESETWDNATTMA